MIGFTALDFVWEAPIAGTGDRLKADGVWTGTFGTDEEINVENIIFQPGFDTANATSAIPNTRAYSPLAEQFQGEGVNPDTSPGEWVDLRSTWLPLSDNPQIADNGMWPPSNIGVATPLPVRWFGLTDGLSYTGLADDGRTPYRGYSAICRRDDRVVQIANLIFSGEGSGTTIGDATSIFGHLFVFQHQDALTNPDHHGLIFMHLDTDNVLTFAVIGETYLPADLISEADVFRGYIDSFTIYADTEDQHHVPFVVDVGSDAQPLNPIFGTTAERSVFQVLPVRAEVIRNRAFTTGRFLDRRAAGFYWRGQLTGATVPGESELQYQAFVDEMRNRSVAQINIDVRWVEVGGVGRDVLPADV